MKYQHPAILCRIQGKLKTAKIQVLTRNQSSLLCTKEQLYLAILAR